MSDGSVTEIQGDGIQAGTEVIVGELGPAGGGDNASPFAPQFLRRRG